MLSRRGLMLVLSSPSGAGKTSISRKLLEIDDNINLSVSATTRKRRPGEVEGKDYHFVDETSFKLKINQNYFLEYAEVFDHFYGTPAEQVADRLKQGKDVLFDVDWQGGQQVRNSSLGKHVLSIFILPPSIEELERRLRARAQDSEEVIAGRMAKSRNEISHWPEYDYVLINDDLDETEQDLKNIITSERMRLSQQPGLVDRVRRLNSEFEDRL